MNGVQFHKLRAGVQSNASPGSGDALLTMEENLRHLLMSSGIFDEVEIEHTDDPDQLVVGMCRFSADLTETEVGAALQRLWQDRARYPFWEAHSLTVGEEFVEFEAATRSGENGHYVTVHMVAESARIPMQRVAQD